MAAPSSPTHPPLDPAARRSLALTIAALAGIGVVVGGGGAVWSDVLDDFGVGESTLGLGFGLEGLAVMPTLLLGARLTGRVGAVRMVALGAGLLLLAAAWTVAAAGLVAFLLLFLARGVGLSMIDLGSNTIAMELERETRRHLMGFVHAGFSGGVVLGAAVALAAYALDASHVAVYAVVAAYLAALAAAAGAMAGSGRGARRRGPATAGALALGAFRSRIVQLSALANALAFGVEVLVAQWVAAYLRDERDASAEVGALSVVLFAATMLVGRLTNGMLTRRFAAEALLVAQAALVLVGGVLIAGFDGLPAMLAGSAIVGFGVAGIVPTVLSLAAAVSEGSPGDTAGASLLGGYLGALVLPLMAGGLTALLSLRAGIALVPVGGLATVATAVLILREVRSTGPVAVFSAHQPSPGT